MFKKHTASQKDDQKTEELKDSTQNNGDNRQAESAPNTQADKDPAEKTPEKTT